MPRRFASFKKVSFLLALLLTTAVFYTPSFADNFEVNVTFSQTGAVSGIKVYAFTESGAYTGLNVTTDATGTAVFDKADFTEGTYNFRIDYLNEQFWSDVASIPQDSAIAVFIEEGNVDVTVRNQTDLLSGIKVYLFNAAGAYLSKNATTDTGGLVHFVLPVGMAVKFRADNLGYQFWSDPNTVTALTNIDLLIPYQSVTITVNGTYQSASDPIAGIKTYLFTAAGAYMGQTRTTDSNGQAIFNLPERGYKVRADYQSKKYWSAEFTAQDASVDIHLADAQVEVTANGLPLQGVTVYVFTQSGAYLGIKEVTGGDGRIAFRLSAGDYKFRTDYLGSQYWSIEQTLIADQANVVSISTGGGAFSFTANKGAFDPLANISCYVFTEAGVYLGMTSVTDIDGNVVFNLSDGRYKIRVDCMGYQFWSDVYEVPLNLSGALSIDHTDVEVLVQGSFQSNSNPIEGVGVYLFTPQDTFLGISQATDSSGRVVFNLPDQPYKVRADYLTRQYWSPEFTAQNKIIDIPLADADVWVSWNGQPLEKVPVFIFNDSGAYLGITGNTDVQGETLFRLPAETFKFRADYLGNRYFSGEHSLLSDVVNPIDIFIGGTTFNLTVLKDLENPLVSDKTYLFNSTGAYLGLSNTTDANGHVSYDLPEGNYKFRVDTLGYQFWTGLYDVPDVAADVFTIPHQDVTITVQGVDPGLTPLDGVDVYLFTPSASYLGLNLTTDLDGQVAFKLPEKPYKVRADFLGQQFWSDAFQWQDTPVDIPRGTVELHVHLGGADISGAKVYLFSESGSYLGWFEVTDENGNVSFLLPDRPYEFRIDYNGEQYWSDDVTAAAGTTSPVNIDLTPPKVDINADPSSINVGGSSTLNWSSTNAYSCTIEPDIGEVDVNGSYVVSPSVTTTYTITATGPGGGAIDSIEVLCGESQLDVTIDRPTNGQTIVGVETIVQGTFYSQASEVGVTVNGFPAEVSGNTFFANHVKLPEGTATIEVVATDASGNTATKSLSVSVDSNAPRIELSVTPESGLVPMKATLKADLFLPAAATDSSLSWTGPLAPTVTKISLAEYSLDISTSGVYSFTYTATAEGGTDYQQEIIINALSLTEMDNRLKAKWNGLQAALSVGNIEQATLQMAFGSREKYNYNFNLLNAHLADIAASIQSVELVNIYENIAEYNVLSNQNGQTASFYLLFIKDTDGVWRIRSF